MSVPFLTTFSEGRVKVTCYPTGHVHLEINPDVDDVRKQEIKKFLSENYAGILLTDAIAQEIAKKVNKMIGKK